MIFRKEWLALDDDQFAILTMLTEKGEFKGTINDICDYLNRSVTSRKKKKIKRTIQSLFEQDLITYELIDGVYSINIISKGEEILIRDNWINFERLRKGDFSVSVSWTKILKVLIWLENNGNVEMTNSQIVLDTRMSETSVTNAKKVLINDYKVLLIDYTYYPVENGVIRRKGQIPQLNAWSSTPAEKVQKYLE